MHWTVPTVENVELHIAPSESMLDELVRKYSLKTDFHIISGLACFNISKFALKANIKNKFIMAEAPDQSLLFRPLRFIRDYLRRIVYAKDVVAYLCIGNQALKWFSAIKSKESYCYPFTYTVKEYFSSGDKKSDEISIIYVGSLIKLKRVDILIKAYLQAELGCKKTRLFILGNGPEVSNLKSLLPSGDNPDKGNNKRIDFVGSKPQNEVYSYLSSADILVLPSRHDGWGAVVNEALQCGCQVIVSDRCGSSDVINNLNGFMFNYPSISDLSKKLELSIARQSEKLKGEIINQYSYTLSPQVIANYLGSIIDNIYNQNMQIVPPWKQIK